MNKIKHLVCFLAASVILVSTIEFGAMYVMRRERREAQEYLAYVRSLRVGQSQFAEFSRDLGRYPKVKVESGCNAQDCVARVMFENTWGARLRLATPASLHSMLTFEKGRLTRINVGVWCYPQYGGGIINSSVSESLPDKSFFIKAYDSGAAMYSASLTDPSLLVPGYVYVRLTPEATTKQREEAYSFNLDVLDHRGTCNDASDILTFAHRFTPPPRN
jgi:hypothetical protein